VIHFDVQPIGIRAVVREPESGVIDVDTPELIEVSAEITDPDSLRLAELELEDTDLEIDPIEMTVGHILFQCASMTTWPLEGDDDSSSIRARIPRCASLQLPDYARLPKIERSGHLLVELLGRGSDRTG
jgi:hypothetical protein